MLWDFVANIGQQLNIGKVSPISYQALTIENIAVPLAPSRGLLNGRQFLFRQALFRQAQFRQALFRQALFRHFKGLLM